MRILPIVLLLTLSTLAGAGAAAAATAPSVTTGPVTSVAPTTATVSGNVNPNGVTTTWYVEYGTATSYGTQTSSTSAGSGTTTEAVTASLASLKAGTTYHYRFVATSSAGTTRGADGILTTSSVPAVVTGGASNIAATSATLTGTVDPSGRPTTWYFDYGTSTNYGTKTAAKDAGAGNSASPVSAAVTGLTAGKTYHFRLVATNDAGTSRGSDKTFVASAAPAATTKPASSVKDTTATLNGSVNPNGQATTLYFEYGTSTSYGTKTGVTSAGAGTSAKNVSAAVSGLAGGVTYHFRVVATNAAGTTAGGDQAFTTSGAAVVHTGPPTSVTGTSATLTGTVDPDGHATSWYFEYGTSTAYGTKLASQNAGSDHGARAVSAAISGLTPGTTYHFRLVATSSVAQVNSADATFSTVGPAVTISASAGTVIFRRSVTLRGKVSNGQANVPVAVYAARVDSGSFTAVATVLTGVGGFWSLTVRPPIRTTYKALYGTGSAVATVLVRPAVSLVAQAKTTFATHVTGARSFARRLVLLQRQRLDGSWLTIGRTRLSTRSTAVFHPALPHGRSLLRVTISAAQAGSGYLAGYSARLAYRRR